MTGSLVTRHPPTSPGLRRVRNGDVVVMALAGLPARNERRRPVGADHDPLGIVRTTTGAPKFGDPQRRSWAGRTRALRRRRHDDEGRHHGDAAGPPPWSGEQDP